MRLPCGCRKTGYYWEESQLCQKHRDWLEEQERKDFGYLSEPCGDEETWDQDPSVELHPSDSFGSHGVSSAEAQAERLVDEHQHHGSTPSYEYD